MLLFVVFTMGCSEDEETELPAGLNDVDLVLEASSEDANEALNVLVESVEMINSKDLDGYANLIGEEIRDGNREAVRPLFEEQNATVEIDGVEMISESDDEVIIAMKQHTKTEIIGEDGIHETTVTAEHTLIREDGDYKIYESNLVEE